MSDLDRAVDELSHDRGAADAASAIARRARRAGSELEARVDKLGDEALDDYEDRRERLDDDLTGELPRDSPEPA